MIEFLKWIYKKIRCPIPEIHFFEEKIIGNGKWIICKRCGEKIWISNVAIINPPICKEKIQ